MSRHKKRSWLWVLIPVLAVAALFVVSVNYLIDPAFYRNLVQKSLTANLGREVTIGRARLDLWPGIGVVFEDLRIKDRSLRFDLLQSKRLILRARLLPLLRGEVRWKRIIVDRPVARLTRDRNGDYNFFDASPGGQPLKGSGQKLIQVLSTLFGGSLSFREGTISLLDESLGDTPVLTEIRAFSLQLSEISHGKAFPFRLAGRTVQRKGDGLFSIEGTVRDLPQDLDLTKGTIDAEVKIEGIDLTSLWPYLKKTLPLRELSGILDVSGRYRGQGTGAFKASGKASLKDVVYDQPQVFSYVHTPKWVKIDFDLEYDKKDFNASRFSVELPEIAIKGKGKIYGIGTPDMGVDAEAQSGFFDLSDAKKLIPYGLLRDRELADHLFRAEGRGPVQIVSARVAGKMDEVEHCDELRNAHTLSVELNANKIRLKLPWEDFPILQDVKSRLSFKQGHLSFRELDGRFLHSTLERVSGVFEQLLQSACTLEVHAAGRLDLVDLPALVKAGITSSELTEALGSVTSLSGRADCRISARGELRPPFLFRHDGTYTLSKVRFKHAGISMPIGLEEGKLQLSNSGLQWTGVRLEMGNCSLLLAGSVKSDGASIPVEITAKGKVDLRNLLSVVQESSLSPEAIRAKALQLRSAGGSGQITFKAAKPAGGLPLSFEGEFLPKEAIFHPRGFDMALTIKEGALSFSNTGVGFSKLKLQAGASAVSIDGTIRQENLNLSTSGTLDLRQLHDLLQTAIVPESVRTEAARFQGIGGEVEVHIRWIGKTSELIHCLRQGDLRFKGVSFRHDRVPVPVSDLEGSFLFSPGQFRWNELKGKIGESPVSATGVLLRTTGGEQPSSLSLQLSSPQLDLDALFSKKKKGESPSSLDGLRELLSKWILDVKITALRGVYAGLPYQDLRAEMKTIDGRLRIDSFQFRGAGGDFWGEGWVEPADKGIRFEIKPRVSNMDAKAFLRLLLQKGREERIEISGRVHISKVELRGEGEDFQKVKESLQGGLRFEFENGIIERFNLLSKIFSILNVSQFFKLRFPDLRTKGLPYRQITANVRVKDGVASTEDLLVDSDAIRITLLGKVDTGRNQIDARVGVHPLGTVDTVLSNVPIVGYILTGKDKAFLSVIYQVKGDLDDPKIDAIPLKSAGEGLLGIMKRILETPFRPFQKIQK
jgi:uncharacterized protein involved in outer membrane biogenesis